MASRNYQILKKALLTRRQVVAVYDGHERYFCPHVAGHTDEGVEVVLCYQFDGKSGSKLIRPNPSTENWRCFHPREMRDIVLRDGEWCSAPDYSAKCTCVPVVDVAV